ncbi:hypothetical protein D9M68_941370 [compost metagenome]
MRRVVADVDRGKRQGTHGDQQQVQPAASRADEVGEVDNRQQAGEILRQQGQPEKNAGKGIPERLPGHRAANEAVARGEHEQNQRRVGRHHIQRPGKRQHQEQ